MGTLYLVATPIGNLEDISLRALRILREVNLIAAEDTRHSRKLLEKYEIRTPLTSYHEHSKETKLEQLMDFLEQGDVALISDAGMPSLNDPGYELIRAAIKAGHNISPVPGPSAPVTALVTSGLPTDKFLYIGYLPRKKNERQQILKEIAHLPFTLIFLETPHRLLSSLRDCQQFLGDRQVAVARELTKLHEEIFRGTLHQAQDYFGEGKPRGEFTLVISGDVPNERQWSEKEVRARIMESLEQGTPVSKIAGEVASQSGWPRRIVYKLATETRNSKIPR